MTASHEHETKTRTGSHLDQFGEREHCECGAIRVVTTTFARGEPIGTRKSPWHKPKG